jgi:hypothetical protein
MAGTGGNCANGRFAQAITATDSGRSKGPRQESQRRIACGLPAHALRFKKIDIKIIIPALETVQI